MGEQSAPCALPDWLFVPTMIPAVAAGMIASDVAIAWSLKKVSCAVRNSAARSRLDRRAQQLLRRTVMHTAKIDDTITVLRFAPEADDLQRLAAAGVKAVVNLRQAGEEGEKAESASRSRRSARERPGVPPLSGFTGRFDARHREGLRGQAWRLAGPVAIHCASGRRASLMGLASWAQRTGGDAARAAARGRQSGLEVSEADLSPLIDASGDAQ
ncbi:MAG: hypothetical protein B7X57_10275 [Erythrobacter sp. 34-65-8]|nr:MAG: hypothetical protein B7X57_10275 [Erythrobacter sp. 34-65-8]